MTEKSPTGHCSFCGNKNKKAPMITGAFGTDIQNEIQVLICPKCVKEAGVVMENTLRKQRSSTGFNLEVPTPREIYAHLDKYVVGQEDAKKVLAVAVNSHYMRLVDLDKQEIGKSIVDASLKDVVMEKSNILLMGPTGCGKTLLAKSLAEKLNVPLAIGDATTLTEAGYVGEDVENLLLKLLMQADFDIDLAQRGIIYIDEIDKIGSTGNNVSITRDVSGQGVQQSLLKMIEGTIANVPPQGGRKHPEQQYIQIDTTNILFICGGAFNGLADIIQRRVGGGVIGFGKQGKTNEKTNIHKYLTSVEPIDLEHFGLIPELVGRLPVLTALQELTEDDLVNVLTEPANALVKQYQKLFAIHGVGLEFTPGALKEIAHTAKAKGTGARALRSVVEGFMIDYMFHLPDYKGSKTKFKVDVPHVRGEKKLFSVKNAA